MSAQTQSPVESFAAMKPASPPTLPGPWFSRSLVVFWVAMIALVVRNAEFVENPYVNHDVANALWVGQRIFHGDLLYLDWFYFVMPPIVYLSAGACALASLLGVAPYTALHLLVVAIAAVGVRVIREAQLVRRAELLSILSYLVLLIQLGVGPADFGQREHLFALSFVPYLLWRLANRPISKSVVVVALLTGFFSMNKPHFLIGLALAEFLLLFGPRSLAIWWWLGAGLVLPFALLAFTPEALEALFTVAIPYHLSSSYGSYDGDSSVFETSVAHLRLLVMGPLMFLFVGYATVRGRISTRLGLVLVAVCVWFYFAIWHQGKYYAYHALTCDGVLAVFLAWMLGLALEDVRAKRATRWVVVGIVILLCASIGRGVVAYTDLANQPRPPIVAAIDELTDAPPRVMIFSPSVEGAVFVSALSGDLEVVGPWTSLYTLPSILGDPDPERREQSARDYFEALTEELGTRQPDLVVISPSRQAMHAGMFQVLVREFGVFPTEDYAFVESTRDRWAIYANVRSASLNDRVPGETK